MLCLGTDFEHKNRLFALELLEELRARPDWKGQLVLAGPRARFGSSSAEEREWLARRPELAGSVVVLAAVSEAEKAWLLRHGALVLYPTVNEGFGLVPFEAAEHGTPCLWAAGSALGELLPDAAAGIVPWDAAASATRALALMREEGERAANIEAIRRAGAALTWDATAQGLLAVYRAVCDEPPAPAGARARTGGLMREGLSEDGVRLVGPEGALPRELERPLLALATHPRVARPAFAALNAAYRAWIRVRERRP
jgi:glycosyltransferase involved in cell wall biosynthesis